MSNLFPRKISPLFRESEMGRKGRNFCTVNFLKWFKAQSTGIDVDTADYVRNKT